MIELRPELVEALDAERDAFNARFALRMRAGAKIDPAEFLTHLQEAVLPLVGQVQAVLPERTRSVLTALYDVSLDLFAASLLGPDARLPQLRRVWSELLPNTIGLLARQPQQLAGCLSNALFHIATQSGTRPEQWLLRMRQIAPECTSVGQLLEAGKVAAWQSGMVQFRQGALEAAARLPASLAGPLLGLSKPASEEDLSLVLARLAKHPWLTAEEALDASQLEPALKQVAVVGAFTGFGGVLARPPLVDCRDGRLVASDGAVDWELLADACGAWFRRIGESCKRPAVSPGQPGIKVDRHGAIRWQDHSLEVPYLASATSFACDGVTLAVTLPTSHHLFLFSLVGQAA